MTEDNYLAEMTPEEYKLLVEDAQAAGFKSVKAYLRSDKVKGRYLEIDVTPHEYRSYRKTAYALGFPSVTAYLQFILLQQISDR